MGCTGGLAAPQGRGAWRVPAVPGAWVQMGLWCMGGVGAMGRGALGVWVQWVGVWLHPYNQDWGTWGGWGVAVVCMELGLEHAGGQDAIGVGEKFWGRGCLNAPEVWLRL